LNIMTAQGGDFGDQARDEPTQPPQSPQARPFGQEFTPPAYAEQPPVPPDPNAPRYLPPPGPAPPWNPPAPNYPPPSGYGPSGYPDAAAHGGPSYPQAPPPYGPSYPSPGYSGGYGGPPAYPGSYDPYNPYSPYQSRSHETNGLAIGSLITSIAGVVLGIPLSLFCWLGVLIPVVGAVLGGVALNQIKRTGQQGHGLAVAGIAIGTVAAVLLVIIVIAFMAAFTSPAFH
jgi:tetrahydromethanopterin S-methyltransferase subunit F